MERPALINRVEHTSCPPLIETFVSNCFQGISTCFTYDQALGILWCCHRRIFGGTYSPDQPSVSNDKLVEGYPKRSSSHTNNDVFDRWICFLTDEFVSSLFCSRRSSSSVGGRPPTSEEVSCVSPNFHLRHLFLSTMVTCFAPSKYLLQNVFGVDIKIDLLWNL